MILWLFFKIRAILMEFILFVLVSLVGLFSLVLKIANWRFSILWEILNQVSLRKFFLLMNKMGCLNVLIFLWMDFHWLLVGMKKESFFLYIECIKLAQLFFFFSLLYLSIFFYINKVCMCVYFFIFFCWYFNMYIWHI